MEHMALEFPEEWGIQTRKLSMEGVWIFSGTTHGDMKV